MTLTQPGMGGMGAARPAATATSAVTPGKTELPKCFGTDYFGKWNMMGMTFDSMKIDKPEYQSKCAFCSFFERCYLCNHIRLLRIKH